MKKLFLIVGCMMCYGAESEMSINRCLIDAKIRNALAAYYKSLQLRDECVTCSGGGQKSECSFLHNKDYIEKRKQLTDEQKKQLDDMMKCK